MTRTGVPPFEFTSAGRILFGRGVASQVTPLVGALGRRALVVVGRDPSRHAPLIDSLSQSGVRIETFSVPTEPSVEQVRRGGRLAREAEVEVVVGLGGGSALDAADAVAVRYELEVSSPGLDRVLAREKDFAAACGSEVRVETRQPVDGSRRFRGRLVSFESGVARLLVDGREHAIPFAEVAKAHAVYQFSREDFARP